MVWQVRGHVDHLLNKIVNKLTDIHSAIIAVLVKCQSAPIAFLS